MLKFKKQLSEKELVEGCIRNDRYCQEQLYRMYFDRMIRMCMRYTSDREVALEIVNTGFLRVYKKLDTFAFKGSLEGWIRRLVFHSLSDYFKKQSRSVRFLDLEDRDAPLREDAYNNLYLEDLLKLVEMLPNATKEVFCLYAIEGFTHVEIAKRVNISVGTSKWHLATARKKLKQLIRAHYNTNYYAG